MKRAIPTILLAAVVMAAAGNVTRETKISVETYANNYAAWALQHIKETGKSQLTVMLPSVYVYDAAGNTLYYGQNIKNDVPVLESLPNKGLKGVSYQPRLQDMLGIVPDLKKEAGTFSATGKQTVVSITAASSRCAKCALQDAAISKLKQRSDLNVVEVRLQ